MMKKSRDGQNLLVRRAVASAMCGVVAFGVLVGPSAAVTTSAPGLSPAVTAQVEPTVYSSVVFSESVASMVEGVTSLKEALEVTPGAKSSKITELYGDGEKSVATAESNLEAAEVVATRHGIFGKFMDPSELEASETNSLLLVQTSLVAAERAVSAWQDEVAAQNKRDEEAAAKAAAEAAAAAASAGGSSGGGYASSGSGGGWGSFAERVAQGAAMLPFGVGYAFGNDCYGAVACYKPGPDVLYVTDALSGSSACYIAHVLAHESRHRWQSYQGLIQFSNGQISNRDWLESDAQAFASGYGC